MQQRVIVGFLVAYDYSLLKYSLPLAYNAVDTIVLSIDADRLTWAGDSFDFDEDFRNWVTIFDKGGKVVWKEDKYYVASNSPMENETRQRNMMFTGIESYDWYVQLDADEYFIDFTGFCNWLKALNAPEGISVAVKLKTIFKQEAQHWYLIGGRMERVAIAVRYPQYSVARQVEGNEVIEAPFAILHQSWARTETEVLQKLQNWGHRDDLDAKAFISLWRKCDVKTHKTYRYFHPLHPSLWQYLECIEAEGLESLIKIFQDQPPADSEVPKLPILSRFVKRLFSIGS